MMAEIPASGQQVAGLPPDAAPGRALVSVLRRINPKWVIIGACVLFTIYIAVIPLGFLLWQSFFTPQTATQAAEFTFGNYITAYTDSETAVLFGNSLRFAVGVAALAFTLGTTLAWLNERTNTPFKSFFYALTLIPLVIP